MGTRVGSVLLAKAKTVPVLGEALPLGLMAAVAAVGLSQAGADEVAAYDRERGVLGGFQ